MKKKDKVIIAMVIMIICIAAGISYLIFLPEPTYPLESDELVGTWYLSGQDLYGFSNWTYYFYSNGSGKEVQEGGLLMEPNNDTFLWEIRNGTICLEYTNKNNSKCREGRFIGDYNHLELKTSEFLGLKVEIKFIFEKIG